MEIAALLATSEVLKKNIAYVNGRNALIPAAEKIANTAKTGAKGSRQKRDATWNSVFSFAMERLVREAGL